MNRRTFTQLLAATAAVPLASPVTAETQASASTPFSLSVMLWTIERKKPFEERLELVASAGYTNVELVGEYKDWTGADFDRANAARKRLGLRFDATAGLHHGLGDPSVRDTFLTELKDALGPMKTLDCPAMIVLSGNVVPGLSHEQQHESCIEGLRQAAKLVEGMTIDGQPVRLLLECIDPEENPKYFLTSAAEAIEIVRAVNHPQVQFLYDLFHEQIAEGNLIEKLEKNIDVIGLIHIADVPGRHEPGTGEINYANIYRTLARLNYRHFAAMEFLPTGDPAASLRSAREMVARSTSA